MAKASDAVSACTQVKMEDASDILRLPKSECPRIWIRQPRWYHLGGITLRATIQKHVFSKKIERKYLDENACSCTAKQAYLCLCMWTGRKENPKLMWEKRRFFGDAHNENAKLTKWIVEGNRKLFESFLSAGTVEILLGLSDP